MTSTELDKLTLEAQVQHIWTQNFSALAVAQPELAKALAEFSLPPGTRWVLGRDSQLTAQLDAPATSCGWLGGSSMPSVSAPAILRDFVCTGANVLLPDIAAGQEAAVLCRKMMSQCAVFVAVPDLGAMKTALHVRELGEWIESGRLVFLHGKGLEEALMTFLRAHTGYEVPSRLVTLPHLEVGSIDSMRTHLERSALQIERERAAQVQQLREGWYVESVGDRSRVRRVAIVSSEARAETTAIVRKLERTLKSMGFEVLMDLPNKPSNCHVLARVGRLRVFGPDLILASGHISNRMLEALPTNLGVINWIWPTQVIRAVHAEGAAVPMRLVVLAGRCEPDEGGKEKSSRLPIIEVGADSVGPEPADPQRTFALTLTFEDAVVLADLSSVEPSALGITQPTHALFWKSVCERLEPLVGKGASPDAAAFLDESVRRAKIELKDTTLRSRFADLLTRVAIPRFQAIRATNVLKRAGFRVRVGGQGWSKDVFEHRIVDSLSPWPEATTGFLKTAGLVVFPSLSHVSLPILLDVLAGGGCPVFRTPAGSLLESYPQLHAVLEAVPQYRVESDLARFSPKAVAAADFRSRWAKARERVKQGHTLTHRVEQLLTEFFSLRK